MISNPGADREKRLNRWAWAASIIIFLLVLTMRRYKFNTALDLSFLPGLYSILNTITFFLLLVAYYFIRVKKDINAHSMTMKVAIMGSVLFLILYVIYHFTNAETSYCGEGGLRYLYFFILITHVILAAVILPFILFTYIRAITEQFERHRKLARWIWPVWLYVSISGPIIYLMLQPCY